MQAITVGGAIIDIVVSGVQGEQAIGNKENVDAITLGIGGGAANASLAIRASGMDVGIVCALGDDAEGQWIRSVLERAQVDLSLVQCIVGQATGKAVIHLDKKGEARVFAQRGASTQVSPCHALEAEPTTLIYVSALSTQAEVELAQALHRETPLAARVVINPGMGQIAAFSTAFSHILSRADLVCLNESETRMLALKQAITLPDDINAAPAALLAQLKLHPQQSILITLGDRGALFCDGDGLHFSQPARVSVQSTLGAGDAFCATFASHWARGQPVQTALAAAQTYCTKVLQSITANLATEEAVTEAAGPLIDY